MTSPAASFPDDALAHPPVLRPHHRRTLTLVGGVLGALIGPTGFLLQMRLNTYRATGEDLVAFPGSPGHWADRLDGIISLGGGQAFVVCGFFATLALVPFLIRWLETRAHRTSGAYYVSAAIGGVALGTVATVLVAWALFVLALIIGSFDSPTGTGGPMTVFALLGGVFIFGPLTGLIAPFFFILPIVGAGIPFGVIHGFAVRRLVRRSDR
jgi:hypothetical protein